jgi:hypothetical protein
VDLYDWRQRRRNCPASAVQAVQKAVLVCDVGEGGLIVVAAEHDPPRRSGLDEPARVSRPGIFEHRHARAKEPECVEDIGYDEAVHDLSLA